MIHIKFKNPEKNHRFSFSNTHTTLVKIFLLGFTAAQISFILTVSIVLSKEEKKKRFFFSMIQTYILGLALFSWLGSHLILIFTLFLGGYTTLIDLNHVLNFGDIAVWESGIWKTYLKRYLKS